MVLTKPELLSPAGDWDSMVAAVQNGADAVYMGGRNFSARQQAANFDKEELARAVDYAHVRGVKVYVTVNTLITDGEMEEVAGFLRFLYNAGVDAVIVQDPGLIRMAGLIIPELELHASTQMTVHSAAAARLIRDAGVKRVVLAREMGLDEIKEIKSRTGVEVEVFVHGALCICYSGQCLMSSMIGGRSGNRGRCAQPCRLQYRLEDENGKLLASPEKTGEYLLSPRDLNLSACIPQLIAAGIDSFKIEGRMKRPEYVATVTRIYRAAIDKALQGDFYITGEEKSELEQIFNRDFTTGYFFGHPGRDLMSYKRPNNRGILLGRVKRYSRRNAVAEIKLDVPLRVGDGLEVWVSRGGRVGVEVRRIFSLTGKDMDQALAGDVVKIGIKGDIQAGDRVFKTYDALLAEKARSTYTSDRETRKIPVSFVVSAAVGEPFRLSVTDGDGFTGEAVSDCKGELAQKRPLDREFLLKQLDRLGNTPYSLRDLQCHLDGKVMVPVREINKVRRQALERLSRARAGKGRRKDIPEYVFKQRLREAFVFSGFRDRDREEIPSLAVSVSHMAALQAAVRSGADEIYFGGDGFRSRKRITVKDIEEAKNLCHSHGVRLILSTPRILHDHQYRTFLPLWEKAVSLPLNGIQVSNLGLLELARREKLPIYSDFTLNVFNTQAIAFLRERNVHRVSLSPELTLKQLKKVTFPAEVLVHGAIPLMVSRYCALGGVLGKYSTDSVCTRACKDCRARLRDRKGVTFPVEVDYYCYMHIFNSRVLCMVDGLDEVVNAGVTAVRVDARLCGSRSTEATVGIYREALDRILHHSFTRDFCDQAKAELARYVPQGFTRGHFFRGVV